MSYVGEQLHAPEGYRNLSNDRTYHYVGRSPTSSLVVLCFFSAEPANVHLEWIGVREFEEGLVSGAIQRSDSPSQFPPWLQALEGVVFTEDEDANQRNPYSRHLKIAKERLDKLDELFKKSEEVIRAKNPFSVIDRYARNNKPTINQRNARIWFFTYIVFGKRKTVLLPAYINCGHKVWELEEGEYEDNGEEERKLKLGRTSAKGKGFGYRLPRSVKRKIIKCYNKRKKLGVHMTTIFGDSLIEDFGCKTRTVGKAKEFYHPADAIFPSYGQFRRVVTGKYGLDTVQKELYGETRKRTKKSASKGEFTEEVSSIYEKMEADAYTVNEVPVGPINGQPMPPLYVVRIRDVLAGYHTGTGFSIGAERRQAYRMALFSMAIPKSEYCAMFGLEISDEEWLGVGIPSWLSFDRGPGAAGDLIEDFKNSIPITQLSPSYEGQSKAVVESSHPKNMDHEGEPTYVFSNMTYVELMKREILRTIADNSAHDVSRRILPHMSDVFPTPIDLFRYFDERLRTDAVPLDRVIAITHLLDKVVVNVKENGVYFEGQRYDSKELREAGVCDRVIVSGTYKLTAYTLGVVGRFMWVEYSNRVIKVEVMLPFRTDDSEKYTSITELKELHKLRKQNQQKAKEHRQAVRAEARQRFKEETGKRWDGGTRRKGRSKRRTKEARAEFSLVLGVTRGSSH